MSMWSKVIWPFLSKFAKYIFRIFEASAKEVAKQIPAMLLEPIKNKIVEVAQIPNLSGLEKMAMVRDYAKSVLAKEGKEIGQTLLDTFLQNVVLDLKTRGIVK